MPYPTLLGRVVKRSAEPVRNLGIKSRILLRHIFSLALQYIITSAKDTKMKIYTKTGDSGTTSLFGGKELVRILRGLKLMDQLTS